MEEDRTWKGGRRGTGNERIEALRGSDMMRSSIERE